MPTSAFFPSLPHLGRRRPAHPCSMAYSRISLADVAAKLALPSVEDTECIVAKAIRDGGVDAVLDHEAGAMVSKETQVGGRSPPTPRIPAWGFRWTTLGSTCCRTMRCGRLHLPASWR